MPGTHHEESHFTASAAVRDVVIGMADGLTVPFALAAGISGAVAASANAARLVVTAGLAEIAAGSIAMGLGGYLAAKTDSEHYESEREREYRETIELPHVETEEVRWPKFFANTDCPICKWRRWSAPSAPIKIAGSIS